MATLIVKNFPDPLYRFLRIQAAMQGTSIKQVVIDIVGAACLRVGATSAELEGDVDRVALYATAMEGMQKEMERRILDTVNKSKTGKRGRRKKTSR